MSPYRFTNANPIEAESSEHDQWDTIGVQSNEKITSLWIGTTYLFPTSCKDPKAAMASIKRDKNNAKKKES